MDRRTSSCTSPAGDSDFGGPRRDFLSRRNEVGQQDPLPNDVLALRALLRGERVHPGALHSGIWAVDRAASDEPEVHDVMPVLLLPRSGRERLLRHDDCDGLAVELERKRVRKSRCWRPPLPGLGVALCHGRAWVCGWHGVLLKARPPPNSWRNWLLSAAPSDNQARSRLHALQPVCTEFQS